MFSRTFGLFGLMLVAFAAGSALGQSGVPFTLTFSDAGASSAAAAAIGGKFDQALNPALDQAAFGTGVTLTRTTLPPCVVRVMHLHRNVDELVVAQAGSVAVAAAFPNGTIVRDVLKAGQQSFLIVRNWVHTVYNPDCKKPATFLAFLNSADGATSNVAAAAFNINAGPFAAYTAPQFQQSVRNALGVYAVDPACLARCNLGPINGQQPAPVYGTSGSQ